MPAIRLNNKSGAEIVLYVGYWFQQVAPEAATGVPTDGLGTRLF